MGGGGGAVGGGGGELEQVLPSEQELQNRTDRLSTKSREKAVRKGRQAFEHSRRI